MITSRVPSILNPQAPIHRTLLRSYSSNASGKVLGSLSIDPEKNPHLPTIMGDYKKRMQEKEPRRRNQVYSTYPRLQNFLFHDKFKNYKKKHEMLDIREDYEPLVVPWKSRRPKRILKRKNVFTTVFTRKKDFRKSRAQRLKSKFRHQYAVEVAHQLQFNQNIVFQQWNTRSVTPQKILDMTYKTCWSRLYLKWRNMRRKYRYLSSLSTPLERKLLLKRMRFPLKFSPSELLNTPIRFLMSEPKQLLFYGKVRPIFRFPIEFRGRITRLSDHGTQFPYESREIVEMDDYEALDNEMITFYTQGTGMFESIMQAVRTARSEILILVYALDGGETIADVLLRELQNATDRGVSVYISYDMAGIDGQSMLDIPYQYNGGVSMHQETIEPDNQRVWKLTGHHHQPRDHKKFISIDGIIGYTGGANFGDDFGTWDNTHTATYKDMYCRIIGPTTSIFRDIITKSLGQKGAADLGCNDSAVQMAVESDFQKPLMIEDERQAYWERRSSSTPTEFHPVSGRIYGYQENVMEHFIRSKYPEPLDYDAEPVLEPEFLRGENTRGEDSSPYHPHNPETLRDDFVRKQYFGHNSQKFRQQMMKKTRNFLKMSYVHGKQRILQEMRKNFMRFKIRQERSVESVKAMRPLPEVIPSTLVSGRGHALPRPRKYIPPNMKYQKPSYKFWGRLKVPLSDRVQSKFNYMLMHYISRGYYPPFIMALNNRVRIAAKFEKLAFLVNKHSERNVSLGKYRVKRTGDNSKTSEVMHYGPTRKHQYDKIERFNRKLRKQVLLRTPYQLKKQMSAFMLRKYTPLKYGAMRRKRNRVHKRYNPANEAAIQKDERVMERQHLYSSLQLERNAGYVHGEKKIKKKTDPLWKKRERIYQFLCELNVLSKKGFAQRVKKFTRIHTDAYTRTMRYDQRTPGITRNMPFIKKETLLMRQTDKFIQQQEHRFFSVAKRIERYRKMKYSAFDEKMIPARDPSMAAIPYTATFEEQIAGNMLQFQEKKSKSVYFYHRKAPRPRGFKKQHFPPSYIYPSYVVKSRTKSQPPRFEELVHTDMQDLRMDLITINHEDPVNINQWEEDHNKLRNERSWLNLIQAGVERFFADYMLGPMSIFMRDIPRNKDVKIQKHYLEKGSGNMEYKGMIVPMKTMEKYVAIARGVVKLPSNWQLYKELPSFLRNLKMRPLLTQPERALLKQEIAVARELDKTDRTPESELRVLSQTLKKGKLRSITVYLRNMTTVSKTPEEVHARVSDYIVKTTDNVYKWRHRRVLSVRNRDKKKNTVFFKKPVYVDMAVEQTFTNEKLFETHDYIYNTKHISNIVDHAKEAKIFEENPLMKKREYTDALSLQPMGRHKYENVVDGEDVPPLEAPPSTDMPNDLISKTEMLYPKYGALKEHHDVNVFQRQDHVPLPNSVVYEIADISDRKAYLLAHSLQYKPQGLARRIASIKYDVQRVQKAEKLQQSVTALFEAVKLKTKLRAGTLAFAYQQKVKDKVAIEPVYDEETDAVDPNTSLVPVVTDASLSSLTHRVSSQRNPPARHRPWNSKGVMFNTFLRPVDLPQYKDDGGLLDTMNEHLREEAKLDIERIETSARAQHSHATMAGITPSPGVWNSTNLIGARGAIALMPGFTDPATTGLALYEKRYEEKQKDKLVVMTPKGLVERRGDGKMFVFQASTQKFPVVDYSKTVKEVSFKPIVPDWTDNTEMVPLPYSFVPRLPGMTNTERDPELDYIFKDPKLKGVRVEDNTYRIYYPLSNIPTMPATEEPMLHIHPDVDGDDEPLEMQKFKTLRPMEVTLNPKTIEFPSEVYIRKEYEPEGRAAARALFLKNRGLTKDPLDEAKPEPEPVMPRLYAMDQLYNGFKPITNAMSALDEYYYSHVGFEHSVFHQFYGMNDYPKRKLGLPTIERERRAIGSLFQEEVLHASRADPDGTSLNNPFKLKKVQEFAGIDTKRVDMQEGEILSLAAVEDYIPRVHKLEMSSDGEIAEASVEEGVITSSNTVKYRNTMDSDEEDVDAYVAALIGSQDIMRDDEEHMSATFVSAMSGGKVPKKVKFTQRVKNSISTFKNLPKEQRAQFVKEKALKSVGLEQLGTTQVIPVKKTISHTEEYVETSESVGSSRELRDADGDVVVEQPIVKSEEGSYYAKPIYSGKSTATIKSRVVTREYDDEEHIYTPVTTKAAMQVYKTKFHTRKHNLMQRKDTMKARVKSSLDTRKATIVAKRSLLQDSMKNFWRSSIDKAKARLSQTKLANRTSFFRAKLRSKKESLQSLLSQKRNSVKSSLTIRRDTIKEQFTSRRDKFRASRENFKAKFTSRRDKFRASRENLKAKFTSRRDKFRASRENLKAKFSMRKESFKSTIRKAREFFTRKPDIGRKYEIPSVAVGTAAVGYDQYVANLQEHLPKHGKNTGVFDSKQDPTPSWVQNSEEVAASNELLQTLASSTDKLNAINDVYSNIEDHVEYYSSIDTESMLRAREEEQDEEIPAGTAEHTHLSRHVRRTGRYLVKKAKEEGKKEMIPNFEEYYTEMPAPVRISKAIGELDTVESVLPVEEMAAMLKEVKKDVLSRHEKKGGVPKARSRLIPVKNAVAQEISSKSVFESYLPRLWKQSVADVVFDTSASEERKAILTRVIKQTSDKVTAVKHPRPTPPPPKKLKLAPAKFIMGYDYSHDAVPPLEPAADFVLAEDKRNVESLHAYVDKHKPFYASDTQKVAERTNVQGKPIFRSVQSTDKEAKLASSKQNTQNKKPFKYLQRMHGNRFPADTRLDDDDDPAPKVETRDVTTLHMVEIPFDKEEQYFPRWENNHEDPERTVELTGLNALELTNEDGSRKIFKDQFKLETNHFPGEYFPIDLRGSNITVGGVNVNIKNEFDNTKFSSLSYAHSTEFSFKEYIPAASHGLKGTEVMNSWRHLSGVRGDGDLDTQHADSFVPDDEPRRHDIDPSLEEEPVKVYPRYMVENENPSPMDVRRRDRLNHLREISDLVEASFRTNNIIPDYTVEGIATRRKFDKFRMSMMKRKQRRIKYNLASFSVNKKLKSTIVEPSPRLLIKAGLQRAIKNGTVHVSKREKPVAKVEHRVRKVRKVRYRTTVFHNYGSTHYNPKKTFAFKMVPPHTVEKPEHPVYQRNPSPKKFDVKSTEYRMSPRRIADAIKRETTQGHGYSLKIGKATHPLGALVGVKSAKNKVRLLVWEAEDDHRKANVLADQMISKKLNDDVMHDILPSAYVHLDKNLPPAWTKNKDYLELTEDDLVRDSLAMKLYPARSGHDLHVEFPSPPAEILTEPWVKYNHLVGDQVKQNLPLTIPYRSDVIPSLVHTKGEGIIEYPDLNPGLAVQEYFYSGKDARRTDGNFKYPVPVPPFIVPWRLSPLAIGDYNNIDDTAEKYRFYVTRYNQATKHQEIAEMEELRGKLVDQPEALEYGAKWFREHHIRRQHLINTSMKVRSRRVNASIKLSDLYNGKYNFIQVGSRFDAHKLGFNRNFDMDHTPLDYIPLKNKYFDRLHVPIEEMGYAKADVSMKELDKKCLPHYRGRNMYDNDDILQFTPSIEGTGEQGGEIMTTLGEDPYNVDDAYPMYSYTTMHIDMVKEMEYIFNENFYFHYFNAFNGAERTVWFDVLPELPQKPKYLFEFPYISALEEGGIGHQYVYDNDFLPPQARVIDVRIANAMAEETCYDNMDEDFLNQPSFQRYLEGLKEIEEKHGRKATFSEFNALVDRYTKENHMFIVFQNRARHMSGDIPYNYVNFYKDPWMTPRHSTGGVNRLGPEFTWDTACKTDPADVIFTDGCVIPMSWDASDVYQVMHDEYRVLDSLAQAREVKDFYKFKSPLNIVAKQTDQYFLDPPHMLLTLNGLHNWMASMPKILPLPQRDMDTDDFIQLKFKECYCHADNNPASAFHFENVRISIYEHNVRDEEMDLPNYIGDMIQKAERHIYMTTPYIFPNVCMEYDLMEACERGVNVVVLLPAMYTGDVRSVRFSMQFTIYFWVAFGVRVYMLNCRSVHHKLFAFDDDMAGIGSTNFDMLSMEGNDESLIVFEDDPEVSQFLMRELDREIRSPHCTQITREWLRSMYPYELFELMFHHLDASRRFRQGLKRARGLHRYTRDPESFLALFMRNLFYIVYARPQEAKHKPVAPILHRGNIGVKNPMVQIDLLDKVARLGKYHAVFMRGFEESLHVYKMINNLYRTDETGRRRRLHALGVKRRLQQFQERVVDTVQYYTNRFTDYIGSWLYR